MRGVSMALMKSHAPIAALTQISIAPTPFISGTAKFGNSSAARSWAAASSDDVNCPSPPASIFTNGHGSNALCVSGPESRPSLFASNFEMIRPLAALELISRPLAECAYPVTAPCALAQRRIGVVHVGQPLLFVPSEPG